MTFVAKFKIKEQNTIKAKFTLDFKPSKVSQLENDLHFQTEEDVASTVQSAVEEVTIETDAKITEVNQIINNLSQTVEDNYLDLDNKITVNHQELTTEISEVNQTINNLSQTVEDNYLDLDNKITVNHQEITDHIDDKNNPHEVTKTQIGLGNVDNTSDLNKPVSTATQTALDTKVNKTSTANRVYGTDENGNQTTYSYETFGKVDDVRVDGTSVVTDKIANLGSMANEDANDYSTTIKANSLYAEKSLETTVSNHISNKNNPHEVTKTQIGLGNVDNTSDLNKPVSTAVQAELSSLSNSISSNYTSLNNRITEETATLNTAITTENTQRQSADSNLQSQIDAIVSAKDVTDIVGTYEELENYDTSGLAINSIIKVISDSTHNNATSYYIWTGTSWDFKGSEGPYATPEYVQSNFVDKSTTINNKSLSNNITLTPSDIGALPSSTVIGSANLTIQVNSNTIDIFNANATLDKTINISVPVDTGDLTNNAGYIKGIDDTDVINALGYTPYDSTNPDNYITVNDLPTNYVTTDTVQSITAEKTFVGDKLLKFKGISSSSKLGFTAFDNNNREIGYLEGAGIGNTSHSFRLGIHDETSANYDNKLGFEYYKEKGTDGSLHYYSLLCPPLYPSTTTQDLYIPISITNGTLTVNADNKGSVDISSLLPDTSEFVTSSTLSTTLENYQPLLVSGTNIKTINGISLLGNGNITIEGGGSGTVDQVYDPTSTNAQSGVAIAGAHFLTSSDLPTIGNGEITVYQGSTEKGSFRMNQTSNSSLFLDSGANFEGLITPIPSQGFIPEGSSSTYPITSLECIVTYTEETDPDTGEPVVDPETGMTSRTLGTILYYDMNMGNFYTYSGAGFELYQGEVTDPYMPIGDFSARAGLLYRKWSYTDSSSMGSSTIEYYYTYGEIGGYGGSLNTYDSSGRNVGNTDITLSIDEMGSGVTVSATLYDSDHMTYKTLSREWNGDILSSSEDNIIITNSDGTLVANMGMKQNALTPGENISIDYTTNMISANISTTDYLNEYDTNALSSRGAYYALTTKENILSSENTGDGIEITIEKGHNLPEGYTEYATLNCRNAYINTGLYGSEKTRFEIYGHYQYSGTSYTNLFGDRTTSGKHMCLYNGAWRVGSQNVSSYTFYNSYGSQSDHLFIGNQYGCIYDNTKNAFSTTTSAFTTTNTLLLMGVNGSSPTASSQTFYFRYAKIYEGDTLVFYGVPAKRNSDSAMGIYDLVSNSFFKKAGGSGSFSAGTALSLSKRIVAKSSGGTVVVDSELSTSSTNPVQNKVITTELNKKIEGIDNTDVINALGYTPYNSTNPDNYITANDLPTNYVTTDTAQDISGRKTFLGEKAIYFKQQATSNKLGFTLYNPSNTELAALEYRPNTIGSASLLALNCPQTTGGYVGFRYWGTPAVNIVAPKVATAGNYFIPTHITDGTNTVTASNTGTVNISTLLPDVSNFVTNTSLATTLQDYVLSSDLSTTLTNYVTSSSLTTVLTDYQPLLVSGTNIKTINNTSLLGSGNISIPTVTVDQTFDGTSQNAQSGVAMQGELSTNYQSKLVSGTNIKTVNNTSILGLGNFQLQKVEYESGSWSLGVNNLGEHNWNSVTNKNGTYLALSTNGWISTSTDGITWTTPIQNTTLSSNDNWGSICCDNNKFVALSSSGLISTSTDGINWSNPIQSSALGDHSWQDMIYVNGIFVCISSSGWVSSSSDGVTWVTATRDTNLATYQSISSISYGNSKFIALNRSGYIWTSTDGITWSNGNRVFNVGGSWLGIDYHNGQFIAINNNGYISTSIDGTTWTTPTQPENLTISTWNDIFKNVIIGWYGYTSKLEENTILSDISGKLLSIGFSNNTYPILDGTNGLIPDARISTNIARTSDIPDISTKQDTLVSGTNIKTINNQSILGSGNIDIQSGVSMTYDSTTETLTFA